jgi:hypothetical protein
MRAPRETAEPSLLCASPRKRDRPRLFHWRVNESAEGRGAVHPPMLRYGAASPNRLGD